jgi:uncharacterized protein with LGFP repeats
MKITRSRFTRRSVGSRSMAVIAAGGLVLGAAACSDDDDDSDSTATATAASTEDADAGSDGSDGADTSGSEGADGAEGSDGGSGDGEAVTDASQLPEDIAAAYEQAGGEAGALGAFSEFTTDGDNTLATFANGWITSSPETGAQPLIGEIGNTWNEGGALQNPVGLPTAPETGDPVSGWDQEFQNGTIGWHPDETGTWAATE